MGHVHAGGVPSTRPALSGQALAARLLCGGAQPCAGAAHRHGAAGGSIASRGPEVRQRRGGHSGAHWKQAAVFRQGQPASVRPLHPGESAAAYAQVSGAQGGADATRWGGLANFTGPCQRGAAHGRPSARAMANTPRGKGVKAPKKVRSGRATARRLGCPPDSPFSEAGQPEEPAAQQRARPEKGAAGCPLAAGAPALQES